MDEETKEKSDLTNARAFVDQIDGINLDLDRLLGYQAEYKDGSDRGLCIQEYREALRLDDIQEVNSLCFLSLKEDSVEP